MSRFSGHTAVEMGQESGVDEGGSVTARTVLEDSVTSGQRIIIHIIWQP